MPKIYIYRNLHRLCWSIRYRGKVIAHCDSIKGLGGFKVGQAGRQRVIKERARNVHAFAVLDSWARVEGLAFTPSTASTTRKEFLARFATLYYPDRPMERIRATYRPMDHTSFVDSVTGLTLGPGPYVIELDSHGAFYTPT